MLEGKEQRGHSLSAFTFGALHENLFTYQPTGRHFGFQLQRRYSNCGMQNKGNFHISMLKRKNIAIKNTLFCSLIKIRWCEWNDLPFCRYLEFSHINWCTWISLPEFRFVQFGLDSIFPLERRADMTRSLSVKVNQEFINVKWNVMYCNVFSLTKWNKYTVNCIC